MINKKRSTDAVKTQLSSLQAKFKNGDRRIGLPLLGLGAVFTVLGVSLFMNKTLMRLGNLMFIAGVPTTIGPSRTASYFFKPQKTRATACLFAGIFLVFIGWPITGICCEVFGIVNLFGNAFPLLFAVVKNMPIVSSLVKATESGSNRSSSYGRDRDPYSDERYDDGQGYYGDDNRDEDPESYY